MMFDISKLRICQYHSRSFTFVYLYNLIYLHLSAQDYAIKLSGLSNLRLNFSNIFPSAQPCQIEMDNSILLITFTGDCYTDSHKHTLFVCRLFINHFFVHNINFFCSSPSHFFLFFFFSV